MCKNVLLLKANRRQQINRKLWYQLLSSESRKCSLLQMFLSSNNRFSTIHANGNVILLPYKLSLNSQRQHHQLFTYQSRRSVANCSSSPALESNTNADSRFASVFLFSSVLLNVLSWLKQVFELRPLLPHPVTLDSEQTERCSDSWAPLEKQRWYHKAGQAEASSLACQLPNTHLKFNVKNRYFSTFC